MGDWGGGGETILQAVIYTMLAGVENRTLLVRTMVRNKNLEKKKKKVYTLHTHVKFIFNYQNYPMDTKLRYTQILFLQFSMFVGLTFYFCIK